MRPCHHLPEDSFYSVPNGTGGTMEGYIAMPSPYQSLSDQCKAPKGWKERGGEGSLKASNGIPDHSHDESDTYTPTETSGGGERLEIFGFVNDLVKANVCQWVGKQLCEVGYLKQECQLHYTIEVRQISVLSSK
uniref:Uncharacterized protein n=1 Tax=Knipowitschia caucasica TaxID=637954 RepID=A0AAV2K083_KNICA